MVRDTFTLFGAKGATKFEVSSSISNKSAYYELAGISLKHLHSLGPLPIVSIAGSGVAKLENWY
jgi:hypothetical protein